MKKKEIIKFFKSCTKNDDWDSVFYGTIIEPVKLNVLILKDFQSHRETKIQFDPAITTIKGPTDRGKSAVLRALQWAALNSIAGDEFIREGAKATSVTLTVEANGAEREILRHRGSINSYALDGDEFKAFGQGVPTDIASILQMSEINFQGQHDSPFWFSETAGEVSRQLNSVIDLSVIDTTLANIAAEVRRSQERIGLTEERLVEAKKEVEFLLPQQDRIEEFAGLQTLYERATKTDEAANRLERYVLRVREHRTHQREAQEKSLEGENLLVFAKRAMSLSKRHNALEGITNRALELKDIQAPPAFEPVKKAFERQQEIQKQFGILDDLLDGIENRRAAVIDKKERAEKIEKQFHERTKGMACPLCGNKLQ